MAVTSVTETLMSTLEGREVVNKTFFPCCSLVIQIDVSQDQINILSLNDFLLMPPWVNVCSGPVGGRAAPVTLAPVTLLLGRQVLAVAVGGPPWQCLHGLPTCGPKWVQRFLQLLAGSVTGTVGLMNAFFFF